MNSLLGGVESEAANWTEGNADTGHQLVLTGAEEITRRKRETYRSDERESEMERV